MRSECEYENVENHGFVVATFPQCQQVKNKGENMSLIQTTMKFHVNLLIY